MKVADFGPRSPGRLVTTIEAAVAFVPSPLPSAMDLTTETVNLIAAAESVVGRLSGRSARLVNPYLIGSPLLRREAILSSRIEGTITTPEQLVLLESGVDADAIPGAGPDAETREVLNYVKAMQHALQRLQELPVCLRLIREVHGVLMYGVRGERDRPGEFRTHQNWIGRRGDSIHDARFVPPPPAEMTTALGEFEQYLNSDRLRPPSPNDVPLLVRLALAHYQFEAIHPFRDGNGRIGRLLIPLLLISHGRIQAPLLYLSSFFERHRDRYMDLLLAVSQRGDWLEWIHFFLQGIAESAEEAMAQAEGLERLRQTYHQKFQAKRASALLVKLVDRLFSAPSITVSAAASLLGVSHPAAAKNIRKLEDAGIIEHAASRGKTRIFVARDILRFMHDAEKAAIPRSQPFVTRSEAG